MNNIKIGTKDYKKWALSILQQKIRPILVELLEARCIFFRYKDQKYQRQKFLLKEELHNKQGLDHSYE
jgi:hypothetical protein